MSTPRTVRDRSEVEDLLAKYGYRLARWNDMLTATGWRHVPLVRLPEDVYRAILPFLIENMEYGVWERVDGGPSRVEK